MSNTEIIVQTVPGVAEIVADDWDRCANPGTAAGQLPENPFITHKFISAVEESGSAVAGTGWAPLHVVASDESGEMIGVMPLYMKSHSLGEYVFDHAWADALERAGGCYYPKLQSGVPFTPVAGRRLLTRHDHAIPEADVARALLAGTQQLTVQTGASSLHIAFCTEGEWGIGRAVGFMQREGRQLHWLNRGYDSFAEFLAALSSRKRKQIKRERKAADELNLLFETVTGDAIRPEHWDAVWQFYQDTGERKWGVPYLTREFFELVHATMRAEVVLFLARDGLRWVAGALNFRGRDSLFGRYWGCLGFMPMVHFELCYYQAIEYAIANRIGRVEAGAGGDYKSARGYEPKATYSLHWILHPGLRHAVDEFVAAERAAVQFESRFMQQHGPYRQMTDSGQPSMRRARGNPKP